MAIEPDAAMIDFIHDEFRVVRAITEENSGDSDDRMAAIQRRFSEARMAQDADWITVASGPDHKRR